MLRSGLIASVANVKRTPYKVIKSASEIVADAGDIRSSFLLDVCSWSDPDSFIRSIICVSELGYSLTGSTNPRYCFVVSDPSRSDPIVLFTAVLVSIVACARYSIQTRRLPRYFPLYQDVPTSKISSIEEVSSQ